ncbi:MAG: hypothetical protein JKY22_00260 [Flavobacteriaceae bacterium]|nr:hypothetical protein [Flavobacteriaceae bacterium]
MARLYGQDSVGTYSVFLATCAIFNSVSILSLEKNIPNVIDEESSSYILGAAIVLLAFSAILAILLGIANYEFYFAAALYIFVMGGIKLCEAINLRYRELTPIMLSRIVPNLFFLAFVIFGSIINRLDVLWLLLGQIYSSIIFLIWYSWKSFSFLDFKNLQVVNCIPIVLREWRFIVYVAPSEILNRLTLHLPIIMVEQYFGVAIAAQYALVLKICLSPLSVICNAVGKVFQSDLAHAARNKTKESYNRFSNISKKLMVLGILVSLFVFFVGPIFVKVAFGEEWHLSGSFIRGLSPLMVIMILVIPTSTSLYVYKQHKYLLASQFFFFLISVTSFFVAGEINDILVGIYIFSALSFVRFIFVYRKVRSLVSNESN